MRNKSKFDSLRDTHIIHCKICNRDLTKNKFTYRNVYEDCNFGYCKYCDWMKRHKNIVPIIDDWNEEEVKVLIDFILIDDSVYLNDALSKFKNKTLQELCTASQILHIGNKTLRVKLNCEYCGKEIEDFPNVYLKNNNGYCSHECYYKDKINKVPRGENNPDYNRIKTNCTCCGKELEVIPYNYNKRNDFGDNFNFCSHKCYHKFRSSYYVGSKSPAFGRKISDETKNKLRIASLKRMKSEDRLNSKIQLKTNDLLDKNHIKYEREFFVDYYSVDNYLSEYNLMIEVMGNYWHANPQRYNSEKYLMNEKQKDWISNDKRKQSYVLNHYGINILYLWETDINNDVNKCEKLILEYIKKNGKLENYHSFNYNLDENGELKLCDNIIIPYQDRKLETYRNLFKVS